MTNTGGDQHSRRGEPPCLCGWRSWRLERPAWLERVWKDLTKKEFIPIKVLFFLMFGATMALFPFLSIHAKSLGITERELSVVFAINPIVSLLGPPITGIFADKIGNFKVFLSVVAAASGAAALVFLAVPAARQEVTLPGLLPFNVSCADPDDPHFRLNMSYKCDYLPTLNTVNVTLANCGPCRTNRTAVDVDGYESPRVVEMKVVTEANNATIRLVAPLCSHQPKDKEAPWLQQGNRSSRGLEEDCSLKCQATVPREDLCSNTNYTIEYNPMLTFFVFLMVRLLNGLTLATSLTLFQGATMAILLEHSGDFGLQLLYANLGAIFMTPLSGFLIDHVSVSGIQDFRPAFYLYFGLKLLSALVIFGLNLDFRMPSDRVTKDFKILLKNPEVVCFLVVVLVTGMFFGILDTFLFWLLDKLGATKSLMGITVTVGTSAGIPILIASGSIIARLGHANTMILGLAVYVIRMIGYSFITDPWLCMPFEVLECFTVSLMGAAAVSYAADLATPATIATLQGAFGGVHHGFGKALGTLVGGFLIKPFGIQFIFRAAGVVSAIVCVIYFFVNHFFFHKQQQERQERAKTERKQQINKSKVENNNGLQMEKAKSTDNRITARREYTNQAFEKEP